MPTTAAEKNDGEQRRCRDNGARQRRGAAVVPRNASEFLVLRLDYSIGKMGTVHTNS
jgi:hypothetical protein